MDKIWEELYNAARAVQCGRRISEYVEAGGVAAAVLSDSGKIYTGACVDTACTLGICAERNAIFNMITNGEHRISKVIAIMPDGNSGAPCGSCRGADDSAYAGGLQEHRNNDRLQRRQSKDARGAYPGMVDMIQINDLKFSYPDGSAALRGVSLSVKPGEFVTLCGLSGCGKSTLLRLMKPGLFPRGELSGDVRFLGRKLTSEPDRDAAAKIGFVMQDPEAQTVTDKVWHELAFSCGERGNGAERDTPQGRRNGGVLRT